MASDAFLSFTSPTSLQDAIRKVKNLDVGPMPVYDNDRLAVAFFVAGGKQVSVPRRLGR